MYMLKGFQQSKVLNDNCFSSHRITLKTRFSFFLRLPSPYDPLAFTHRLMPSFKAAHYQVLPCKLFCPIGFLALSYTHQFFASLNHTLTNLALQFMHSNETN